MSRRAQRELPTGTVTFLFSDVEGSTRLVQQLGEDFTEVLEQQQALIRRALADHNGVEVSTEGDSFFAVFSSAAEAVAAASAAQRSLAGHDFPGAASVRVRIGLHSGVGRLGGDNYVGLDVHRGARIASAAHGGQVLLSEATRALVADLPGGLAARDVGEHRLKDLETPERLHQLVIEGLPDDFPPPRSLGSAANLPQALTSFVGRDEELAELSGLLEGTRLLTLTGPGGTGKTRLALETARRGAAGYRDGAHFVALDAIRDADLVATTIVQALRAGDGSRSPEEALAAFLADRQLLLVLDNFEQILRAVALVDRLLAAAPQLRLIVTSRVPLQLYGEQEYRVAPLALPDLNALPEPEALSRYESVALFVERARAGSPAFALTPANAPAVAEICVRLDGLPLAIELAAARVKLLPPSAILARLGQRLDILAGQSPNLPARQRTLRAAIDWSWELLDESERRLFERLAVFSGGWELEAAEAVTEPAILGLDLLDGMASLLDKSLIVRVEAADSRFTMLQTIAEYARERLAQRSEADETARRHALHFRALTETAEGGFGGPQAGQSVALLAPEQDNLRAALGWASAAAEAEIGIGIAAAMWRYWQERGQLREGRDWLERLRALPGVSGATALRARALTAAGGIAYWQGDNVMHDYYREALGIYRALDDKQGIADSLQNLGFAVMTSRGGEPGASDESMRLFEESLSLYRELNDRPNIASVVGALGFSKMMTGRHEEARAALSEALELNTALGRRGRANDNRWALGHIYRLMGDMETAGRQYRAALVDVREMGDASRTLMQLVPIASYLAQAGRRPDALRLSGAIERAREEQGGMLAVRAPGLIDPLADAEAAGLPRAEIDRLLAEGRQMDLPAAVEYTLSELRAE